MSYEIKEEFARQSARAPASNRRFVAKDARPKSRADRLEPGHNAHCSASILLPKEIPSVLAGEVLCFTHVTRSLVRALHFRRRYHRRKVYTKFHKQLLDDLFAGNRIGLKLSRALDIGLVEERNFRYTEPQTHTESDEFIIAQKRHLHEDFAQNYAVIRCWQIGNARLFIHGRELFSEALAKRVFVDGEPMDSIPYEEFDEQAKMRVRRLLQPATMLERVGNSRPLYSDDPSRLDRAWYRNQERNISDFEKDMLGGLKRVIPEFVKLYKHYEKPLEKYLAEHDYDRQIISNFREGMTKLAPGMSSIRARGMPSLQEVLYAGIDFRTETLLREAASKMSNPYDERFVRAECEVARTVVESVQPRVLRNLLRHSTAILVTDDKYVSFGDVASDIIGGTMGKYEPCPSKFATLAQNDFILLSSPYLDARRIANLARHELEHHLDYTNEHLFAVRYKSQGEWLVKEKAGVDALIGRIEAVTGHSADDEVEFLRELARKRSTTNVPLLSKQISEVRAALLEDLAEVKKRAGSYWHEPTDVFRTLPQRLIELPPVIEELKGEFGPAFVKAVLPQSYRYATDHRLRHAGLTDIPKSPLR